MVSFLELVEIVVAARFRASERVSFRVVKRAYENAQAELGYAYPFAHLELRAMGGHIVRDIRGEQRAADQPEQRVLPSLVTELVDGQFKYEDELAVQWYPRGYDVPIVLDPRVTSGVPTIEGRRVAVQTIYKRWRDQEQPIEFIAADFQIDPGTVERALQYWEKAAA